MPSVTRRSQGSRAERREELEAALLDAVERLLASGESFTELSVERLVSEARVSRSTFYVYFQDKGDMLQALTEGVITDFMQAASEWWDLPPGASRDQVAAGLGRLVDTYRPHATLVAAVTEVSAYDSGVRARFGEMLARSIQAVADHIRRGQEAGTVRTDLDPDLTAAWLTWMTERGLYQLVRNADDARAEALSESLTGVIWNTLYEGAS